MKKLVLNLTGSNGEKSSIVFTDVPNEIFGELIVVKGHEDIKFIGGEKVAFDYKLTNKEIRSTNHKDFSEFVQYIQNSIEDYLKTKN